MRSFTKPVLFSLWIILLFLIIIWQRPLKAKAIQTTCSDSRIAYSTFIGGTLAEDGNDITVDSTGQAYLATTTYSTVFPAPARGVRHGVDVAGLGLNVDGTALQQLHWINPAQLDDQEDHGLATATDAAGNRYVAGYTLSEAFCSTVSATASGIDTTHNGNADGFLFKVNGSDGTIAYCTFIGGTEPDFVRDITVAADGTVYLTGSTFSEGDFPGTVLADHSGARDIFVTSVNPAGTAFGTTTLLGGSGNDLGRGITVAADGTTYVTGWTFSADFPTTASAFITTSQGSADGFVSKIDAAGTVVYATYLAGNGEDRGYDVAVDASGRAHVTGSTKSADFPVTIDAYDNSYNNVADGYLAILAADGQSLVYSTYLGGAEEDRAYGLQLVGDDVYLAGFTKSADFPLTADALDNTLAVDDFGDAFIMRFDKSANVPTFSTFWGGDDYDSGNALAVDSSGAIYLVGDTKSADLCTTATAYDQSQNGDSDLFVVKIQPTVPTAVQLGQSGVLVDGGGFGRILILLTILTLSIYTFRSKTSIK